jgi:hypothetical protein
MCESKLDIGAAPPCKKVHDFKNGVFISILPGRTQLTTKCLKLGQEDVSVITLGEETLYFLS